MPSFTVSLDGIDALRAKIEGAKQALTQNVSAGLFQFGEDIMARSEPITPVDTGFLLSTGHVDLPVVSDDTITVTLGYNAEYALTVHENLNPNVRWSRPGSGPLYLSTPAQEMESELPGRMADAVRKSFE